MPKSFNQHVDETRAADPGMRETKAMELAWDRMVAEENRWYRENGIDAVREDTKR